MGRVESGRNGNLSALGAIRLHLLLGMGVGDGIEERDQGAQGQALKIHTRGPVQQRSRKDR